MTINVQPLIVMSMIFAGFLRHNGPKALNWGNWIERAGMFQLSVRSEYEHNQGWHGSVISQKWVWTQSGVAWFSYQSEVSMNPIRGDMVQLSVRSEYDPNQGWHGSVISQK